MKPSKRIVVAFGRLNPPHTGHKFLIDFLSDTARRVGGDARLYPSVSHDPKKNPLPFADKVRFLKSFFPKLSINDNPAIRTPIAAFQECSKMGYTELFVVVGSDRVGDFQKLAPYCIPRHSPKYDVGKCAALDVYVVVPVPGDRDPDADGVSGMSASKLRGFATAGNYAEFRKGVPTTSDHLAASLFTKLQFHMGIKGKS